MCRYELSVVWADEPRSFVKFLDVGARARLRAELPRPCKTHSDFGRLRVRGPEISSPAGSEAAVFSAVFVLPAFLDEPPTYSSCCLPTTGWTPAPHAYHDCGS